MAITLVGSAVQAINASGVTLTFAKPAGIQDGDYVFAALRSQGSTASSDWALAGFARTPGPAFVPSSSAARAQGIYYKQVTNAAGEPAQYVFTVGGVNTRCAGSLIVLRGLDPATPFVGPGGTYGALQITNGRRVETYGPVANPATVLYSGGCELVANNVAHPATTPPELTEIDFVVTSTNVTISRTTTWLGLGVVSGGAVPDEDIVWPTAASSFATSVALRAIPVVTATFGRSALFTASIVRFVTPTFGGGSRGTFTASVVIPPPEITATFGSRGYLIAVVAERIAPSVLPSLPPACYLYVDGVRYADGSFQTAPGDPYALTDLRVNWGRTTTLDQPAPTTLTFSVLDELGGQRFLERLHIGALVDVVAEATVFPDPTVSIVADSGFESGVLSVRTVNATAVVTGEKPHSGSKSVRVEPVDGTRVVQVVFPPRAFTSNISGWDSVPRTAAGQTWRYGAAVWLGEFLASAQGAKVRPVAFTGVTGAPGTWTVLPEEARASGSAGVWQVLSGDVVPPSGVWLGVCVELYPTGPAWQDVPTGVTWAGLGAVPSWLDLASIWVDDLTVLAPAAGALRRGYVASGRVTDMDARYELGLGATVVDVIAQSHLAELNNRYVGDAPWTVESLSARFDKIVTASGQPISHTVDPGVAGLPVSWRDVDSQPALRLLQELAQSAGGALWSASNPATGGAYLWLEDVDARPSLLLLEMGGDGLVHVVIDPVVTEDGLQLSACDVLLEPVRWRQTTEDNSSRIALTWKEQTVDDKGQPRPTDRTETIVDAALEAATGQRRISVSTQLSAQADALHVAGSLLARVSSPGWRVAGLTISLAAEEKLDSRMISNVMTVLDSSTRIGLATVVTDLPEFSPAGADTAAVYLEGGRFVNRDGAWSLELLVSSAVSQGAADIAWNEMPADWSWVEFGPEVSWADLTGVDLA